MLSARCGFCPSLVIAAVVTMGMRTAVAADAFDALQCDSRITEALAGKTIGHEPAAAIEKRHAAITLKYEGGEEISDSVFYQAWTICGRSYHLIEQNGVIGDVLQADHSRQNPAFMGVCASDRSPTPYVVFAILNAAAGGEVKHGSIVTSPGYKAFSAWRIDETRGKFVRVDATSLVCPKDGISTADGGP